MIFLLCCVSLGLKAQQLEWHKLYRGHESGQQQYQPVHQSTFNGQLLVSYLSDYAFSYSLDYMGAHTLMQLGEEGQVLDSFRIEGPANLRTMEVANGLIFLDIFYFDSLRLNGKRYERDNNTGRVLAVLDENFRFKEIGDYPDTFTVSTATTEGKFLIIGSGYSSFGHSIYTVDSSGAIEHLKFIKGRMFPNELKQQYDGTYLLTGSCVSNLDIDGIKSEDDPSYSNFVMCFDQNLKANWFKRTKDITCSPSYAIKSEFSYRYLGASFIKQSFGNHEHKGPAGSSTDFFLTSIEDNDYEWLVEVPSDTGFAGISFTGHKPMDVDKEGNVYVIGSQRGRAIRWKEGVVSKSATLGHDIFIGSWDSEGELRWVKCLGGSGYDYGHNVRVNGVDSLVISATVGGEFSYNGMQIKARNGDLWIAAFSPSATAGIDRREEALQLFPNPSSQGIWHHPFEEPLKAALYDLNGSLLNRMMLIPGRPIEAGHLPNGIYLLKAGNYRFRLIKD